MCSSIERLYQDRRQINVIFDERNHVERVVYGSTACGKTRNRFFDSETVQVIESGTSRNLGELLDKSGVTDFSKKGATEAFVR